MHAHGGEKEKHMPRVTQRNLALNFFLPQLTQACHTSGAPWPHCMTTLKDIHTQTYIQIKQRPTSTEQHTSGKCVPIFTSSPLPHVSVEAILFEKKRETELHGSSNKLGVCACAQFSVIHARRRVWVWPLPLLSMYTYTPRLYTYMYIYIYVYTAYVQIEKKT